MRKLAIRVLIALSLLGLAPLGGCRSMIGADQVGGVENATWVHI